MDDLNATEGDRSATKNDLDRSTSVASTKRTGPRTSQDFSSLAQDFSRQAQIEAAELEELAERIKKLKQSREANEKQAKINKQNAMNQRFEENLAARRAESVQMISPYVLRAVAYRLGSNDDDTAVVKAVASGQQGDCARLLTMLFKEMFYFSSDDLVQMAKTIDEFAGQEINDQDLLVVANAFGCLKGDPSDGKSEKQHVSGIDENASQTIAKPTAAQSKPQPIYATDESNVDTILRERQLMLEGKKHVDEQRQDQVRAADANNCKSIAEEGVARESTSPHSVDRTEDRTDFATPTRVRMTEIDDGLDPPASPRPSLAPFEEGIDQGEVMDELPPKSNANQVIGFKGDDREQHNASQRDKAVADIPTDGVRKERTAAPQLAKRKTKSPATAAQGGHARKGSSGQKRARDDSSEVSVKSQEVVPRKAKKPREDSELSQGNQKFMRSVEKEIRKGDLDVRTLDCGRCHSEAVDPRVTKCHHIYCVKCVREMQNGVQRTEAARVGCTHSGCGKKIGKVGIVSPEIIEQLKRKHAQSNLGSISAEDDESTKSTVDEA